MKKAKLFMMLALLVMGVSNLFAQDVTISPSTGTLMAASTQNSEVGSEKGYSSTWKHKQLPLTVTVSDFCNLTDGGELLDPAGNMIIHNGKITFGSGQPIDCYMSISLPKGFKFTGYEIVLANDIGETTVGDLPIKNQRKVFYETDDLSYRAMKTDMSYSNANDYLNFQTIVSDINSNPHYLAVAGKKVGNTTYNVMLAQKETGEDNYYVISRTSNDMGNHLYFRLSHESAEYFQVSIVSAKIYFTAEGDFTEEVSPKTKPNSISSTGVNYMTAPFVTGKLDLGTVGKDNNNHYTYSYMNVRDLNANNVIFQQGAVSSGSLPSTPGTGTIYATYNNGDYYYGLKNNTYFVECPVEATDADGHTSPIGFRIVGAKVHYTYGKKYTGGNLALTKEYDGFKIVASGTYIYWGEEYGFTDYLTSSGGRTDNESSAAVWFMDDEGYIRTGNNGGTYLTYTGNSGDTRNVSTTTSKNEATKFMIDSSNNIFFNLNNRSFYLQGQNPLSGNNRKFRFNRNNPNYKASPQLTGGKVSISDGNATIPAFEPKQYTLTVFGKDGSTDASKGYQTKTITSSTKDGYLELTGLNNDAIKFQISGLPTDANGSNYQALITVELTMQALDPFIKSLDIVCQDQNETANRMSQTFTATDFSVRGGAFEFYVPEDYPVPVKFTFENLKSDYADETYPGGTSNHYSRYNFVKSSYFNSTPSLYTGYSVTNSDAASANNTKTIVTVGGNKEFKFNNATEVTAGTATYFQEYPFSVAAYQTAGGTFDNVTCDAANKTTKAYLFTCDETRYNISPQTSTEHRYYAYYEMNMVLKKKTFTPTIVPTLVYENTFYEQATTEAKRLAQYGVKLGTSDKITIDDPTDPDHKKQVNGYLTVAQIKNVIAGLKASNNIEKEQILYVDASELLSVCAMAPNTLDKIREHLGPNVLVYLPEGMSTEYPNFAVKSGTSFLAAKNIVLTDKYPFFAPYNIQVGEANYAYYKRLITKDQNGKVWNGTVILPFTIDVNKGVHENFYTDEQVTEKAIAADGDPRCRFTLAEMNANKPLAHEKNSISDDYGVGYFSPISGTKSVANKPYVVQVDTEYDEYDDDNSSFIVRAYNALIEATPTDATGKGVADYTNETVSGVQFNNATFTFTNTGTYTGIEFDKVVGDVHKGAAEADVQVFYFAHDYFLDSRTLKRPLSLKMLPFRSYYVYTSSSNSKLSRFSIVFGENDEMGGTNGITDVQRDADLAIIPGKGTITIMARADKDVTIHNVRGITVNKCNLRAGDSETINVPAGVYVINGVKMVVK